MQIEATGVAARVVAAQQGDRAALGELIEAHLTMLYNVAGRALNRHADVDDVVQETLLRVVENLSSLREPARFSGWILAILHRQIAERIRRRRTTTERVGSLDLVMDVADPGADFVDATVLRLGLSAQRRQIVEAVRWLEPDERFLLSLWWLEVAGSITRADLATALSTTAGHAAVRLKRMRDQLELARCIVNALQARPLCPALGLVIETWDGKPSGVWRKRLGRHLRDCPTCTLHQRRLIPPDRLLAGVAMLPVPPSIVAASPVPGLLANPAPGTLHEGVQVATTAGANTAATSGASWWAASTVAKTVAATVGAVAVSGGIVAALPGDAPDRGRAPSAAVTASAPARTAPASATPGPSRSAPSTPTAVPARYGSVVDRVDAAPPRNRRPRPLPARPEGTLAVVASGDHDPRPNVTSLIHRGEWATYRGRGYLRIEFAVAFTQRTGMVTMPSWTGLKGKLFHVASGGGRRLDDQIPDAPAGSTGMGDPSHGYAILPDGAQQMWALEYYYLDGEVTLTSNERGADYNLYATIVTRTTIDSDIRTAPNPNGDPIRYGLTRDDGTDACPVPQYATRATPQDPATVRQQSNLR
ncbi:RNA polymerase sigma factor [Micromonospora deserti]|uniref:RNA polymerase subunit sigma n=1 Tax=Micromonospora deserti TaxID=2070366 RepID=A0A2W2E0E7_9ACTN|nr:sigma-70 family RNA polymerase sigma factor [Micromonospora deserti]PZG03007.1 RNA polymerase subunit sigma [Micromonospora deserti]